jgi:hypothetical protein
MTAESRLFLVVYDYGMGGLWGLMRAPSIEQIALKYPELRVFTERPPWIDDEEWAHFEGDPYDLADEPRGLIAVLIDDRLRQGGRGEENGSPPG